MSRDYKNGKIYCIRNNITNDIYVGSSCEKYLSKRWVKHKSKAQANDRDKNMPLYKKMNEIGIENFYIELIENYPCENNDELRAREGHYIRKMATLNKRVETRTDKEWRENKEYVQEWRKQYYQENKEEIDEKAKKYAEENPDKVKQQKKDYYERNKEQIREYGKDYRKENEELVKERKKDYYERKKM